MRNEIEMLRKHKNDLSDDLIETANQLVNMKTKFYT